MASCPSCGHENPDEQKFCGECGTKLESTPVREERKVITALFCDLVGSTALGERLDAEDISRLLRSYQAICRARIESHGGVVEKFIGDAVVGVFGVPLAHEDDPERAVRAALRMIEDVGASDLGIEVRIGVNTGEALVRLDIDPRSGEGFATGDTMNTAARLEAAAPVMGVAVGAGTYRASIEAILYEELPAISAKGKAEPVLAWRAIRPAARVGTEEHDRTPFVGRDLELSMLTQLFERARSRPATEFVTIVAEPGLGKSRLVRELARHVDQVAESVMWREGRCLPYGDGISFWALGEIVKAQAGILETDDQATVSSKLDQALTEPDPQTRTWIKDRLAPLVGLETSTEPPQREEAFTAWRRFLEQIAGSDPTVLVIEDLHWADEAFVAFLEHLAERTAGLPLLLVVTARPEVEERHPSWPPGRRSTVLSLSPLTDGDLEALITQTLPEADPELTRIVLERAGGSPLYAEQLAAMLREQALPIAGGALDETLIPLSVQALIAARIDALPLEPKGVLMEASVIGKTFWAGAVASLGEHPDLEATLAELVRREFCRPVHPSTMEGDTEFGFWHALVRDVAYAELTRAERARMHDQAASWIEIVAAERLDDVAELLAHHYAQAMNHARRTEALADTIDRLNERTRRYLMMAGSRAERLDLDRAESLLREALDVTPGGPDRGTLLLKLAEVAYLLHPPSEVEALARAALDSPSPLDPIAAVKASLLLGGALYDQGRSDPTLLGRALTLLEGQPQSLELSEASSQISSFLVHFSRIDEAIVLADQAVSIARPFGRSRELALSLGQRGLAKLATGDLDGRADVDQALALRRELNLDTSSDTHNLAEMLWPIEGPATALRLLAEALTEEERRGATSMALWTQAGRLGPLFDLGEWDEVVDSTTRILESAGAKHSYLEASVGSYTARVRLLRGDPISPAWDLEEWVRVAIQAGDTQIIAPTFAVRALDCQMRGDTAGALAVLHELDRAATQRIDRYFVAHLPDVVRLATVLGDVSLGIKLMQGVPEATPRHELALIVSKATMDEVTGKTRAAASAFAEGARRCERIPIVPEHGYALLGLGRCLLQLDDVTARSPLQEARRIFASLGARPLVAQVDALLVRADAHRT